MQCPFGLTRGFDMARCSLEDGALDSAFVDLCSEIEETRARVSGTTSAVQGLSLPLWIIALCAIYFTFRLWQGTL